MMKTTVRKRRLCWFGHVYNAWKTPEERNTHSSGCLMKKETEVDHNSGETQSGETSNGWTRHEKTSVSRYLTWVNGMNGLHDVIVSGWI